MLDFTPVRERKTSLREMTQDLTRDDLINLTNEMVDTILEMIDDASDADVVFQPSDPRANDPAAATSEEVNMPWTLGHVIVHTTASSEESAFLAAELARGVENHGRSRYEVHWTGVKTIEQCRQRLEESRRMRLASLDLWPDPPHLENEYQPMKTAPFKHNAISRFVSGLSHDDSHLDQIEDILRQAKAARN